MLRGGMIGAGAWSRIQLSAWAQVEGANIVALCDRHPDRRAAVANEFGIGAGYDDAAAMLDAQELDFVDICVRPYSHAALVDLAAEHGIPVLCQKPFCEDLETAQTAVARCERADVRLMVNENFRWQVRYRQARDVLEGGVLGTPYFTRLYRRSSHARPPFVHNQQYFAEMERMVLYEMGGHYIDAMRMLYGNPESVFCRTNRISPDLVGEDSVFFLLTYPGATVAVEEWWSAVPAPGLVTGPLLAIEGSDGAFFYTADDKIQIYRNGERIEHLDVSAEAERSRFTTAAQQHFVDCLRTGAQFESSGRSYLDTMAITYACYESAERGTVVVPELRHRWTAPR